MDLTPFGHWIADAPMPEVALALLAAMIFASLVGLGLRRSERRGRPSSKPSDQEKGQEGYLVSAVFGLLALLMAFSLALALDRYETRRQLVITEANAIETAYLRTQLMPEPHRSRISRMLVDFTDNRIALAKARDQPDQRKYQAINERMLNDLWAAVVAAAGAIPPGSFANSYVEAFSRMFDHDLERKIARLTSVPAEVVAALCLYLVVAAGVLGYVLEGVRGRIAASVLFVLLLLSMLLVVEINRPITGSIVESQEPMVLLQRALAAQSPAVFDKFKESAPETGEALKSAP